MDRLTLWQSPGGWGISGGAPEEGEEKEAGKPDPPKDDDDDDKEPKEPKTFYDPSQLPEELKPAWKKMHRAYTKKLEAIRDTQEKAEMIDRFRTDPQYQVATMQELAKAHGFTLTKAQAGTIAQGAAAASDDPPPAQLVSAVKDRLNPEMHWMAEAIAAAHWTASKMTMAPLIASQSDQVRSQRETEYDQMAEALTETAPGWEEYEDEMVEMKAYLESGKLSHPKFGPKLHLLYNLVTGNAAAIKESMTRMSAAARNRTTTGHPGRVSTVNVEKRVLEAKTDHEAWDEAAKAALAEIGTRR